MYKPKIDITGDQRYYNMIILRTEGFIAIEELAKSFKDWTQIKSEEIMSAKVIHLVYNTDRPYHRGLQEHFNVDKSKAKAYLGNKVKNFAYDSLILHFKADGIVCLLTPFSELLSQFIKDVLNQLKIQPKYLIIRIFNLINTVIGNELVSKNITVKTTGVGISKRSRGDISNVIIKGNKPLSTDIGELVFDLLSNKNNDEKNIWIPSTSRFKCVVGRDDGLSRINLSLNADRYGNYKLYLQKGCLNLISLIYFISFLNDSDYFDNTSISPLDRENAEI
ncbi:hypothetical protein [Flagellimonas lutaonensis]|uniref:Uncharacterized protein n=1 Tax=Flagellimonas lutaonensis TaxID=516051 RepID=A0A0D5YPP8_9FLAO|nr:hypothetical protein [Allomuricauda lutaonensis]AKA33914.1 hypothetical protein VC82_227 [Allomuricauda lutaonensis]